MEILLVDGSMDTDDRDRPIMVPEWTNQKAEDEPVRLCDGT